MPTDHNNDSPLLKTTKKKKKKSHHRHYFGKTAGLETGEEEAEEVSVKDVTNTLADMQFDTPPTAKTESKNPQHRDIIKALAF